MADTTVPAYTIADMFLRALGAPTSNAMRRAVAIWLRFESGGTIIGNNPWNLHGGTPCPPSRGYCPGNIGVHKGQIGNRYAGPGDQNVAVFATLDAGTRASAQNLIRLAPSYGYGKVINEARAGNALGFLRALQQSSWSAGHYGYTKLVNAFTGSFNYNTKMIVKPIGGGTTGIIPVSYNDQDIAQQIARLLGKSPSDVLTADDLTKLKGLYGNVQIMNDILDKYEGKTISELAKDAHFQDIFSGFGIPDTLGDAGDALGNIAASIGTFVAEAGDIFLFVLGIGVGGIMAFYGFSMMMTVTGTKPAVIRAELVPPKEGVVHIATR